ncbi:MAG: LysR substrate-binding domain-containing protein [Lautropia sp.]|nr:LysR substrate-binding domain-containing protein [Lautropia sp.]
MEDLNDLAYFALVAEHGGFAAAERVSGIPKSRLSRRVADLERQLGVRLIQRSTRRFAITEIGQRTLQHARAMLAEAEAARLIASEQAQSPRGTVRLSCPPALLQYAVADMLAGFLAVWPHVRLEVQATNRNVDVWQDGVDLALRVRAGDQARQQDEIVRTLALSPHVLVAAPGLIERFGLPTAPQALSGLPVLGLGNSPEATLWRLHDPAGAQVEVALAPRLVVDDMTALRCAALAGVGCASLPRLMVHDALSTGALQQLLPDWMPVPGRIQLAYASRQGMRRVVRMLIDALVVAFESLIARGHCLRADRRG